MKLFKRTTSFFLGLGFLLASIPAQACEPAKRCGGELVGYEVWCCGDYCNVYSYEVGKRAGKLYQKNVNPDEFC